MTSPMMPPGQMPPPPPPTLAPARPMPSRPMPARPAGPSPDQMQQMAMARRQAMGAGPNRAKGGPVKAKSKTKPKAKMYAKGGSVSSASKRADGCATKGKTRGKFV